MFAIKVVVAGGVLDCITFKSVAIMLSTSFASGRKILVAFLNVTSSQL